IPAQAIVIDRESMFAVDLPINLGQEKQLVTTARHCACQRVEKRNSVADLRIREISARVLQGTREVLGIGDIRDCGIRPTVDRIKIGRLIKNAQAREVALLLIVAEKEK